MGNIVTENRHPSPVPKLCKEFNGHLKSATQVPIAWRCNRLISHTNLIHHLKCFNSPLTVAIWCLVALVLSSCIGLQPYSSKDSNPYTTFRMEFVLAWMSVLCDIVPIINRLKLSNSIW